MGCSALVLFENMALFDFNGIKINYSSIMKRLSISKDTEWISLSTTSFNCWMAVIGGNEPYSEITIKQNNSTVNIIKLMNNFVLSFKGKNITSYIVIPEYEAGRLLLLSEDIKRKISLIDETKENNMYLSQCNKKNK